MVKWNRHDYQFCCHLTNPSGSAGSVVSAAALEIFVRKKWVCNTCFAALATAFTDYSVHKMLRGG